MLNYKKIVKKSTKPVVFAVMIVVAHNKHSIKYFSLASLMRPNITAKMK